MAHDKLTMMIRYAGALCLLALFVSGCTALFDFSSECSSAQDCAGGATMECVQGLCVATSAPPTDGGVIVDASGDMTVVVPDMDTEPDTGDADQGVDQGAPKMACETHQACGLVANGDGTFEGDSLCVDGFCEQVLFTQGEGGCRDLYGQVSDDPENTIIIPAVNELTGEASVVSQEATLGGYRLAFDLINGSGLLEPRRALLVSCDDNTDIATARDVMNRILDATNALAVLGPGFDDIADAVVSEVTASRRVLNFTRSTSSRQSNIPNSDLVFRVIPTDRQSIEGIIALLKRFEPRTVAMFFRSDKPSTNAFGQEFRLILEEEIDGTVRTRPYNLNDDKSIEDATKRMANDLGAPADYVILVSGQDDLVTVASSYRQAFSTGFTEKAPVFITPVTGARELPLVGNNPGLDLARNLEAVIGFYEASERFNALYQSREGSPPFNVLVRVNYDSAMLTLLSFIAAPEATTGGELAQALRTKLTDPDGTAFVADDITQIAAPVLGKLARGETIQYLLSNGIPLRFTAQGDAIFPLYSIAYKETNFSSESVYAKRVYQGNGFWIDLCDGLNMVCPNRWDNQPVRPAMGTPPDQFCAPRGPMPPGICLPVCSTMMGAMKACPLPAPFFTCSMAGGGAELCLPPG